MSFLVLWSIWSYFFMLFIHPVFMNFFVPLFYSKPFCFLCIHLLVCYRAFSTYLLVEFSIVILECPVLFYGLNLLLLWDFFTPVFANCFSLEFERQQVFLSTRTLLSILADFNNAVVWIVSSRLLNSMPSCSCTNPLVIVPNTPIKIVNTVTFWLDSLFQFSSKV